MSDIPAAGNLHQRLLKSIEFSPGKLVPTELKDLLRKRRPEIKSILPSYQPDANYVETLRREKLKYAPDKSGLMLMVEMSAPQIWKMREVLSASMERSPAKLALRTALHRSYDMQAPQRQRSPPIYWGGTILSREKTRCKTDAVSSCRRLYH